MQEIFQLLEKVSNSDSTVLINGESGTGKELVARAIHYNGPRARTSPSWCRTARPSTTTCWRARSSATCKGSFTGAMRDKKGLFEVADGGTFFLDEVGDMSPPCR